MAAYSTTPPSWPGQDSAYAGYYSGQYPGYPGYNYDPYYQPYYAQQPAPGTAPAEGYSAESGKAEAAGAPPADAGAPPSSTAAAAAPGTDPAAAQQQQQYDYQQYYDYYNSGAYQGYPGGAYAGYPPYPSYPGYPDYSSAQPPAAQAQAQAQGPAGPRPPPGNPSAPSNQQQLGAQSGGVSTAAAIPGPRPPPGNPPPSSSAASSGGAYNAVPPPTANKPGVIRPQVATLATAKAIGASAVARLTGQASAASTVASSAAHYQQAPSYTAVNSSTTTSNAAKPQPPLRSPSASGAGSKFPPTFTAWVERCFERCRTDVDRQAMTVQLTARIKSVESAGRMWAVDWDTEPIPTITTSAGTTSIDLTLSPTSSSRNGGESGGGLRNKRSRWEESEVAAALQQQQQRPLSRKQQKLLLQQQLQQQQGGNKKQKKQQQNGKQAAQAALTESNNRRMARMGRFGSGDARYNNRPGGFSSVAMYGDDSDMDSGSDMDLGFDVDSVVIQGTCTHLEKSYFRLTGPPDPAEVRPPHVLRKALDRLVGLLRQGTVNNFYACDQFKGMRQDCTVQHLRDELAVAVYEAHAREALEYGDLAEFNQCQTQLASLYADGVPGCVAEFTAYKLLYNLVHARAGANKALLHTLRSVLALQQQLKAAAAPAGSSTGSGSSSSQGPTDPQGAVANALRARTAAFAADYPAFFRAYAEAPALGRALLDSYIPQLRWSALNMIVKTYKPSVPVSFVARMLGFILPAAPAAPAGGEQGLPGTRQPVYIGKAAAAVDEAQGTAACVAWLQAHGAVVQDADSPDAVLDAKASMGQLSVPEEPKVAHGDENLSVGDFLARASALLTA